MIPTPPPTLPDPIYRLTRRTLTPPGGWHYTDPETGGTLMASTLDGLVDAVVEHRRVNQIAIPPTIAADIEHAICLRLPPKWRQPVHPRTIALRLAKATSFQAVSNQTLKVLKAHLALRPYSPPVPIDAARADVCRACPFHIQDPGCYACYATQLFTPLIGKWPEAQERLLCTCGVDSTFLRATIHLSNMSVFPDTLPYPEGCWKRSPPPLQPAQE